MRLARTVPAILMALLGIVPVSAQEIWDRFENDRGISWPPTARQCPLSIPDVPESQVAARCIEFATEELARDGRGVWHRVQYRRAGTRVFPDGFVDSLDLDEALIVRVAPGSDTAVVEGHVGRSRFAESIRSVRWVTVETAPVLVFELCLNGTGGCGFDFYYRVGDQWKRIEVPFVEELQSRLPPEYRLHKGQQFDLPALAGSWPLSGPDDPNCCPSGRIDFTLRFERGRLWLREVVSLRIARRAV